MGVLTKRIRRNRRFLVAIGVLAAGLWVNPVRAQDTASAQDEDYAAQNNQEGDAAYRAEAKSTRPFNRMIQTLIVTARKTEERIQQVPVALTAITSDELKSSNQRRLDDVQQLVPNLLLDQGAGLANTARTSLRGLSQSDNSSGADPVVGIYVDGVFRSRLQASVLTLFDVDRIEVLRGPQGTLFGRNAIGGAINITTKQPEFEFGGEAELRVGNFDLFESRLALNVPLVPEKAAVRLSLATATRDGYIKNVTNGDDYLDNKLLGGRLQFLALPREDVEVNFTVESTREDRKGFGAKCFLTNTGQGPTRAVRDSPMVGFVDACKRDAQRDDLKTAGDLSFTGDALDTLGLTNRVTWDISPDVTLTSITAYRKQDVESFFNVDGTEVNLLQFQNDDGGDKQVQYSQELQLTGLTFGGRLRYVAGAFLLQENNDEEEFFGPGFIPVPPRSGPTANLATGMPVFNIVMNPALNRNRLKANNRSFSAFGQATYSITERLDLTLGARLTKDYKRLLIDQRIAGCKPGLPPQVLRMCQSMLGQGAMGPNSFTGFEQSGRFDNISPSATLAYAFSPQVLVYGSYVTGFQSGGFNAGAVSLADTGELENQELTSYELGLKSTWLDNRVVLNAAAFYNILEDGTRIPVPRITAGGQISFGQTLQTGAIVTGTELEFGLLPMPGLQLRASLGLQRAQLRNFSRGAAIGIDDDATLPATPNFTGNFSVDYERPLGDLGTLGLRTSWTIRGKQNPVIQPVPQLEVHKYGLLDGRLSFELPDGRTEIAAFGTNLLDRRYFNAGFTAGDQFGFGVRFFGPPRFYGVELRREF